MDKPIPAQPEPSPYEKMRQMAVRVMAVPKEDIDRKRKEHQKSIKSHQKRSVK